MKKLLSFVALCSIVSSMAIAQTAITPKEISTFEAQLSTSGDAKALATAIANVPINDLALTTRSVKSVDTHFSIETPPQSIHNQLSSGRCWMFSGFNVLRSNFSHQYGDTLHVEFSQDYLFFYDQLEKANLMLQAMIDLYDLPVDDHKVQFFFKNPIADGGTFCGVADLTAKYGLVPMMAQQETASADNTRTFSRLLSSKLREYGLELRRMGENGKSKAEMEQRKVEMLATIYRMLCYGYGEPVKEFYYTFYADNGEVLIPEKKYTPQEFYKLTVGEPLADTFVMIMNDPRREYHKTYEVEYNRHSYDGTNWKYLNLPVEEIASLAIAQLKAGKKVYSSYDVGKQSNRATGLASLDMYDYDSLFGTTFPMDKADRITTFDSGSTHAMTLTAVDLDPSGKPRRWKVENSWGDQSGVDGCMIMTNDWWEAYMFRLVVDKEFVPKKLLKEYEQEPTMLAPDDPLALEDD